MDKTIQLDGYRLHLIPTKKFKNITICLKIEKYIEICKKIVQNRSINFDWKGGTYFVREIRQPFCECT